MRNRPRRRRAALLLALALASGSLAAFEVSSTVEEVEARVGPGVPVVVAREDLRPHARLERRTVERSLDLREVPASFAPPDALSSPQQALGLRLAVPVAAGGYLTAGQLESGQALDAAGPALGAGERIVDVAVAGSGVAGAPPGTRVDVLITTGAQGGGGRTYVALQNVELVRAGGGRRNQSGGAALGAGTLASLRVTLDQAVLLTAAQNFAREVRLLVRSSGDRGRVPPTSVDSSEL